MSASRYQKGGNSIVQKKRIGHGKIKMKGVVYSVTAEKNIRGEIQEKRVHADVRGNVKNLTIEKGSEAVKVDAGPVKGVQATVSLIRGKGDNTKKGSRIEEESCFLFDVCRMSNSNEENR